MCLSTRLIGIISGREVVDGAKGRVQQRIAPALLLVPALGSWIWLHRRCRPHAGASKGKRGIEAGGGPGDYRRTAGARVSRHYAERESRRSRPDLDRGGRGGAASAGPQLADHDPGGREGGDASCHLETGCLQHCAEQLARGCRSNDPLDANEVSTMVQRGSL